METKLIKNFRTEHNVLVQPFTQEELKAIKSGKVSAKLTVSLGNLIDGDIETLNDDVSERITGSITGLTEISYMVIGRVPNANEVILKVEGFVNLED